MPSGTRLAGRVGILKDAAGARRLRAAACASGTRATRARSRAAPSGSPRPTRESGRHEDLAASAAAGCRRSRTPSPPPARRRRRRSAAQSVTDSTRSPMQPAARSARCRRCAPPTVPGVPAQASSPARPWLIVQRTRPLIVTPASARTRSAASLVDRRRRAGGRRGRGRRASAMSTFDPPPSIVTGTPRLRASSSASHERRAARGCIEQPVGRPADLERRERRERRVACDARRRRTRPAGRRGAGRATCARSSRGSDGEQALLGGHERAHASARVHGSNAIQSPGASWPASGRSAAITIAIFA